MANGLHVAIIMDGNGRWARARGLPRYAGHRKGVESVRRVAEAAPRLGISTLTLYAFSSDNWKRPASEVSSLMKLFERYLRGHTADFERRGLRLAVVGRRDRLSSRLVRLIRHAETATAKGKELYLRLAIDYSARQSILRAAAAPARNTSWTQEGFLRRLNRVTGSDPETPAVDLLIRTAGEQRLSDFLLWEAAYAELVFTKRPWPEFGGDDLDRAVTEFRRRERRFGGLL